MTNLKYKLSHEVKMTVILLTPLRPVDMTEKNKKTHACKTQCIKLRRFLQTSGGFFTLTKSPGEFVRTVLHFKIT